MIGQHGFEDSAYGTIHVMRTLKATIITDSDGQTFTVPLSATIQKANPALAFIAPGSKMPPVLRGLAPVAIAK